MPLNIRSTSMKFAVGFFFAISFVGWFAGLDSFTCCKRAIAGAIAVYVIASIVVNIINDILIRALVNARLQKQKESVNGR